MAQFTQTGRPFTITTPLGKDVMLATGFYGHEGISQLFQYTVDVKTERAATVAFDKLMGQPVSLELEMPQSVKRYFHGVCVRVTQAESDANFTDYQLELVPQFWLLTKRAQSRIFQHLNVPDILKKVFAGMDLEWSLTGTFEKRDFCVQYRETDFNFASRLMEEEGIFYFFKHAAGQHTMVIGNAPGAHPTVPGKASIVYKNVHAEATTGEDYITELTKVQEHTSGKFKLWDHTFELAHENNESVKVITESVNIGKVSHKLKVGDNSMLEVYDWPGEYAQRFDGINTSGGEQPAELAKIGIDAKRTVGLRMEQVASGAVRIQGSGSARQLTCGHTFSVETRPGDLVATPIKCEGKYVVATVQHAIRVPSNYRSATGGTGEGFTFSNVFTAFPLELPFRPGRSAAKPVVSGSQTAVVVGPPGEEIYTDKYARVKVQFHWDREQKKNADSSCWVRVAQMSAGKGWGSMSIPRIGQEVVVDFLEGDPDQPIIVGCVYNPLQMPQYKLPDNKTMSYVRSNTSMGGDGYNEIRFEDKAGAEQIYVHSQRNMDERVRNDSFVRIGNNQHTRVGFYLETDHKGEIGSETKKGSQFVEIAVDRHTKVHGNSDEHIVGYTKLLVDGTRDIHVKGASKELLDATADLHVKGAVKEKLDATYDLHVIGATKQLFDATHDEIVKGDRAEKVGGNASLIVSQDQKSKIGGGVSVTAGMNHETKTGMVHAIEAGQEIHLKAGIKVVIEATAQLTIKAGTGFVTLGPDGVVIQGAMVKINSGGAPVSGSGSSPSSPTEAKSAADAVDAADAKPTKPTDAAFSKTGNKSNG